MFFFFFFFLLPEFDPCGQMTFRTSGRASEVNLGLNWKSPVCILYGPHITEICNFILERSDFFFGYMHHWAAFIGMNRSQLVIQLTLYPLLIIYPLLSRLTLGEKVTKCIPQNVSFQAAVSTFFVLCGCSRTIGLKLTPSSIITDRCDWNWLCTWALCNQIIRLWCFWFHDLSVLSTLTGEVFDYLVSHGRMKEVEARAKFRQVGTHPAFRCHIVTVLTLIVSTSALPVSLRFTDCFRCPLLPHEEHCPQRFEGESAQKTVFGLFPMTAD